MVTFSHYKADNFIKSNLIFITSSLSIELVKNTSESKVLDEQRIKKGTFSNEAVKVLAKMKTK